ncbi:hypothetical protein [Fulvivirga sediminis]|uniref:Uncharacterized protein n=1 Tax=Fulvivirga sediminis TaxID=2803949 RepID=A0A937F5F2_9BACT|nr:hypothetical protein [Fulvivirga sediminis]MBL3656706.1 hypothetical protein [Fulvivirga sediminis]
MEIKTGKVDIMNSSNSRVIVQTIKAIRETRKAGETSFDLNEYFLNLKVKVPSKKQTHANAASPQSLYFNANIVVGEQTIPVTFNLVLDYENGFGGNVTLIENNHEAPINGFNGNAIFYYDAAPGNYANPPNYPLRVLNFNVSGEYYKIMLNILNPK